MESSLLAGRYRLITQLGEGGMGSVWRAEHLTLHTHVAVKLIDPKYAKSPQATIRFEREAQAAAELRSTHIVQILDYGISDGTPFIVMELLEGESLASRLGRCGKLSADGTVRILSQVARALSRAHQRDIVHRDLKPDNIYIVQEDGEDMVKVLDFGIAKVQTLSQSTDAKTGTGMLLGTPYYMSPEQAHACGDIDFRSDIWAFGIIACECLTGRRPFERSALTALLMEICHGAIPRPSHLGEVPPGFDAWFARAVARERADRFPNISEAATQLREVFTPDLQVPLESSGAEPLLVVPTSTLPLEPPAPATLHLVETTDPASRTLQLQPDAREKLPARLWLWAALATLVLAGFAVRTWVASTPSVASAAGQSTALPESPNAPAAASATAEPTKPDDSSAAPLALGSAQGDSSDAGAPSAKPVNTRNSKSKTHRDVRNPDAPPDAPALPTRARVQNTNNAAGF